MVESAKVKVNNRLLFGFDDEFLILLPQPESYVAQIAGLHSEIWEGVDTAKYLKEARDSWIDSMTEGLLDLHQL